MTDGSTAEIRRSSLWYDAWRRLRKNKNAILGLCIVLFLIAVAIFAPLIAPFSPVEGLLEDHDMPPFWWPKEKVTPAKDNKTKNEDNLFQFQPVGEETPGQWGTVEFDIGNEEKEARKPHHKYIFGTDDLGRCVFSRVVYGARLSLVIGIISVSIGLIFGTLLGLISGYYGGFLDDIIMRAMDILLSIPYILLAILIVAILGPGLVNAMIAIGILTIPSFARIVRGCVLSLKQAEYVQAARVLGAGDLRIIFRHILVNSISPLIVQTTLTFATAILEAAALGFLGLGAQPPTPEWGAMLADGKKLLLTSPWAIIFPGIAIVLSVLGFNLLGDGLRDALDVRLD